MKIGFYILTLNCFLCLNTFAQKPIPDSLLVAVKNATKAETKINALIDAGDFYYEYYNVEGYSKAANLYEQARVIANASKDSTLIGNVYHSLAQVYDAVGDDKLPKALEYYSIFYRTTLKATDTPRILRGLLNIAATQKKMSKIDDCKKSLNDLSILASKYGKTRYINRSNIFASYTLSLTDDYALSKKYFELLDLSKDTIKNATLPFANMYQLAKLYLLGKENKYTEALKAGESALASSTNMSDSMGIYHIIADYAAKAKNFEKGYWYRDMELDLYAKITRNQGLSSVNNSLLKSELNLKEDNANLLQQKQATQARLNTALIIGLIIVSLAMLSILWLANKSRRQNKKLEEQVTQNNLLLQEVHHRVKNNLQIISSFMLLQQLKKNIDKEELIKQLQSKIQTLALIHQKLHTQRSYDKVKLQPYFEQLFKEIIATFADNEKELNYFINAGNSALNLDTVTPLALIINELLLNSIKYATPNQKCIITIDATEKNNLLFLEYADNGIGLPEGQEFDATTFTGLRLIKALSKQIKSLVSVKKENGKQIFYFEIPLKK